MTSKCLLMTHNGLIRANENSGLERPPSAIMPKAGVKQRASVVYIQNRQDRGRKANPSATLVPARPDPGQTIQHSIHAFAAPNVPSGGGKKIKLTAALFQFADNTLYDLAHRIVYSIGLGTPADAGARPGGLERRYKRTRRHFSHGNIDPHIIAPRHEAEHHPPPRCNNANSVDPDVNLIICNRR